jgi:Relaxase/Mobilisation nuclease domain
LALESGKPLFDLRSFARQGTAKRDQLSRAQVEQLVRTVSRVPEVMVKVSGGAKSPGGVIKHLAYIDRQGELELETDDGQRLKGPGIEKGLSSDWELEELSALGKAPYRGKAGRRPEKLVHNIVLSMPRGTDHKKLMAASRGFVREQFALKHRYALALHTDQGHPHVHVVVKAVSEDGERLNIRKATLREWRGRFAEQLRQHGISANATERAARGQSRTNLKTGIYRAAARGDSRHLRERWRRIQGELRAGGLQPHPGKARIVETRRAVVAGYHGAAEEFRQAGHAEFAQKILAFVEAMSPPRTTDEHLVASVTRRSRAAQSVAPREYTR